MTVHTLERPVLEGLDGLPPVGVLAVPSVSQLRLVARHAGGLATPSPTAGRKCSFCGSTACNQCSNCGVWYCNCEWVKRYHESGDCQKAAK